MDLQANELALEVLWQTGVRLQGKGLELDVIGKNYATLESYDSNFALLTRRGTTVRAADLAAELLAPNITPIKVTGEALAILAKETPRLNASASYIAFLSNLLTTIKAYGQNLELLLPSQSSAPPLVPAQSTSAYQLITEILSLNKPVYPLMIYPELPGLTYDVLWTPNFFNMPTQVSSSGAEVDLGLGLEATHEFTLTYNFLRDRLVPSEFKQLMGFIGLMQGTRGRFYFKNPDDYQVTNQTLGVGDGNKRSFVFTRTFGYQDLVFTEPVGQVREPVIKLNNVLADAATYSLNLTLSARNLVTFVTPPPAGTIISADFSFYYYCKLAENKQEFSKFVDGIWESKTVILRSCRAGT